MARRKAYTKVEKENQIREKHVKGMGDKTLKGFQCLNSKCSQFLFVIEDEIEEDFEIECPVCQHLLKSGEETKFYDYQLRNTAENTIVETGEFSILHDAYLEEAQNYKYCIICNTIKPIHFFDKHGARKSGRQGECRLCKTTYNSIKNQTRITDQHREAAQKRRLYIDLAGGTKIDSQIIHQRFQHKCFKCGKNLRNVTAKERPLDHTLPAYYLWPLTTENATLLCREHNGEKSGKWTSDYYKTQELKRLSVITGIDYQLLSGHPQYNPEVLQRLQDSQVVDALLVKYSSYMNELMKLRNRIKNDTEIDFFAHSKTISKKWIDTANRMFEQKYG